MPELSVILCTHDPQPDYLRRTLDSLKAQTLPREHWQFLIIDNASKNPLAKDWNIAWHPQGRHVREDELGLTAARLRGIKEFSGEWLVFVDDDNVLAPDYLKNVLAIAAQYPRLAVFGAGILEPEFEVPPPAELSRFLPMLALRNVASLQWSNNPQDSACRPYGAGLCVRQDIAEKFARLVERIKTSMVLGRKGKRELFQNEDDLFSWAAVEAGWGFGIFPELKITHLISAGRLEKSYFLRLIYYSTISHWVLQNRLTGAQPQKIGFYKIIHVGLHGARNGWFSMRRHWAQIRGEEKAAQIICETPSAPKIICQKTGDTLSAEQIAPATEANFTEIIPVPTTEKRFQSNEQKTGTAPLISVVIPTFNRAHCIGRAVESVLAQTFKDFELIVVDDGSTDNTPEVLGKFGDAIRLIRVTNKGVSAARNAGIRAANGKWIAFLDSDDCWQPAKLGRQIQCLQKFDEKICFTRCVTNEGKPIQDIDGLASILKESKVLYIKDTVDTVCRRESHPLMQSMVIEKKLIEAVGLFDESLSTGEDSLLVFKLSFHSGFLYVDEPLAVIFQNSSDSITYSLEPAAAIRRYESYLRVQSQMYWRLLPVAPQKAAAIRSRLAYFISRRAELACVASQFQFARTLAKNGFLQAGDFRTLVRCAGIYLLPFLCRIWLKKKWYPK